MSRLPMVLLLQLSIKQELKLSDPALLTKNKKAIKDQGVCPKKKKRKQHSPAKVQIIIIIIIKPSTHVCLFFPFLLTSLQMYKPSLYSCSFCCYRFSAWMMMALWPSQTPSVTFVFTVTLHLEQTTICRGMSSFTLVWNTPIYLKMAL